MNKELNILQAIEMPVGTEFILNFNNSSVHRKVIITEWQEDEENGKRIEFTDLDKNAVNKTLDCEDCFILAKFIPIQKPVSFIEAVEASKEGKRLRVVHDAYCETKEFKKIGKLFEMIISANKNFGDEIVNKAIIENILNGEWYIEEE